MNLFLVYILHSPTLNRFYVGTTNDFSKRLEQHNSKTYKESFSVKGVHWDTFLIINNLSSKQAYAIERHIKSMKSYIYIRNLRQYPELVEKLVNRFKD